MESPGLQIQTGNLLLECQCHRWQFNPLRHNTGTFLFYVKFRVRDSREKREREESKRQRDREERERERKATMGPSLVPVCSIVRVHMNKKLELEVEPGLEPKHSYGTEMGEGDLLGHSFFSCISYLHFHS